MVANEKWFGAGTTSFYNGEAEQSARFNSGSSSYLSFTPSGNGDRRKATLSFWFKRTAIGETYPTMFCCNDSSSGHYMTITFNADNTLYFQTAPTSKALITTAQYRDTTAWYHLCWAMDTTQSTASDRVKCYINGTQITDFSTEQYPDQDSYLDICSTVQHAWAYFPDYGRYFNGYIADAYIIDGQQLTPSSFTEVKEGAVIPIAYTGSFGTNGIHLEFKQTGTGTASTSTIGADTSGNNHHFTSSGMGSDDSNIPDSPENNFATLGGLEKLQDFTLSEGNLKYTTSTNQRGLIGSTPIPNTGKHYFECRVLSVGTGTSNADDVYIGVCEPDKARGNLTGSRGGAQVTGAGVYTFQFYYGKAWLNGSGQSNDAIGYKRDFPQIVGVAVDRDNNNIKWTWDGSSYSSTHSIPADVPLYIHVGSGGGSSSAQGVFNFGQDSTFLGAISSGGNADDNSNGDFSLAVPSGYLALCSANLSEPTISPNADEQADDHFDIVTYTGNSGTNNITFNMSPDLVWIALRSSYGGGYGVHMWDTSRGDDKYLYSSEKNPEATGTDYVGFQTNGFQIDVSWAGINLNSEPYVAWGWKANGSTTSSNSNGNVTTTVQANTDAGFSIVTWTGTASNSRTLGHGLTKQPEFVLIKNRDDSAHWIVYHHNSNNGSQPNDYGVLNLNRSNAYSEGSGALTYWDISEWSNTVFSVGGDNSLNGSGDNLIAYCWHGVEGYSKFSFFEGNANSDGVYVHLGFRPRLVAIKNLDTSGSWIVFDSERHPNNIINIHRMWDTYSGEGTDDDIDFLSNGFKCRRSSTSFNSAHTFVYMAWAEMPEKYSNAF